VFSVNLSFVPLKNPFDFVSSVALAGQIVGIDPMKLFPYVVSKSQNIYHIDVHSLGYCLTFQPSYFS